MGRDKQVKKDSPLSEQDEKLVEIEKDKRLALIDAWEENEKAKAQTKAYKELCSTEAWENNMKTALELDLKKMELRFGYAPGPKYGYGLILVMPKYSYYTLPRCHVYTLNSPTAIMKCLFNFIYKYIIFLSGEFRSGES
ncbi:PREDICTED: uncharacterized protein LOC104703946 isoform X2 [Camelina sativa]|uniref:Uncharacterized protein LOC104703946 isoform X2 n=1 Tax=Camelina sativa TaxID=90675 RepID=A0ABM1QA84_CAMSA|nr:PREDICTED: uncharacterized protein LOC104703946 isoform X2 [Camelina sativa]XP_019083673.1 PREDICTED: uncharacterized protein LOC104703946 isoform X2 [Camelina sativa]